MKIAALIPTYGRAPKLEKLLKNFNETSSVANIYFIVHPKDLETVNEVQRLGAKMILLKGEYVACINNGVKLTTEPFVLCAADDVEFTKDWDKKLLKEMEDPNICIVGGIDSWPISKSGVHISHPLIRRSYIKDNLYYPGYTHYMCDIELIQQGWKDQCVKVLPEILIEHKHPEVKTALVDQTYIKSRMYLSRDKIIYDKRRKNFEVWNFQGMYFGKKIPSFCHPDFKVSSESVNH